MAFTSTGPKGQPQIDPDLGSPDFAEDITGLSDHFASRSFQHYATVAALLSATANKDTDDVALATNAPGAWFRFNGSAWEMHGIARYADASARSTALTAPVAGWKTRLADTKLEYTHDGTSWVPGFSGWTTYTPALANLVIGTGGAAKGTLEWRYEGDQVHVRGALILGNSGFSVGTLPTLTPPVTPQSLAVPFRWLAGRVSLYDLSAASTASEGLLRFNGSTATIAILRDAGTNIGAGTPFTWAAGDVMDLDFYYDPA